MKDFETGVCYNCGFTRKQHHSVGLRCWHDPSQSWTEERYKDSGIQRVEDNAVRVLRALIAMTGPVDKWEIPEPEIIQEAKEAIEASTSRV